MSITKQDLLSAALQLEKDGRAFYLDAASKASNDLARRMLESFADDEIKHMEWIQNVADGVVVDPVSVKDIYGRLKSIFADVPEDLRQSAAASENDVKAINFAVEMEQKSAEAYEKWAEAIEDEEVRALCQKLAEAEHIHRTILENTREYLENTGSWFLQEEGGLLDGGM